MGKRDGRPPLPPPVGKLTDQLLTDLAAPSDLMGMGRAMLCWAAAAGEPVASHSQASSFAGRTLIVEADDPAWVQELSMRRAELLARLAATVGPGVVEELRFVLKRG
jgi:predicted nucleic acid-binding Zn ribbon protein